MISLSKKRLHFQILIFLLSFYNCRLFNITNFNPYIVNGNILDRFNLAKYMVSLQLNSGNQEQNNGWLHFCGGAIIGPKKVLTAAHCLFQSSGAPLKPRNIMVVVGLLNRFIRTKHTRVINVVEAVPHPFFAAKNKIWMTYDVGYLILQEPILFDNPYVGIITLPNKTPEAGQHCTVLGWGRLFSNGPLAAQLAFADIQIFSKEQCKSRYGHYFTKGMMCAGDTANWKTDSCTGDSGGPLICEKKLVGLVSWGLECGMKDYPGVYTDAYHYKQWIEESVQGLRANGCVITLVLFAFVT